MNNSAQTSTSNRINALLDDNSFVEVGAYVTARNTGFDITGKETPADGVVTGYDTVEDSFVYVYSQDASIMGGSTGEMHTKKISNIYELTMKMGVLMTSFVDCAGLRLQEATDALHGSGELYKNQTMASGVIPQISAIFGTRGGGMAVSAAFTDLTFMEGKSAKLFVDSPNAIDGNYTFKRDTSSASFQSEEVGLVDFVGDETTILSKIRTLVSIFPANNKDDMSYDECGDDLNRAYAGLDNLAEDPALSLSTISDDNFFMGARAAYAPAMATGFIRLNGTTVGCVANRTVSYDESGEKKAEYETALASRGCKKATDFVNFCDAFNIPLLILVNVRGYTASLYGEKHIVKSAGKLTYALTDASVSKVTVIVGEAYGIAYLIVCSKPIDVDIVYAWPNASIGMMDATAAAKTIYVDETIGANDSVSLIQEKAAECQALRSSAVVAAKRGYMDDIIEAVDTRKRIITAFEMLFTKREERPAKKHGTV